jgi:hypothetical protein
MTKVEVLTDATVGEDGIDLHLPETDILKSLQAGNAFVVKNIFPADELRDTYLEVFEAFDYEDPKVGSLQWGTADYWRMDDNPPSSSIPKCQALYFLFTWNNQFGRAQKIARHLHQLRNRIAGLDPEFGLRQDDDHHAIPVLQHYPAGGGYIAKHQDPIEPQKCVVSLAMSTSARKQTAGGLFVETEEGEMPLEHMLEAGDLFIFPPNLPHGVAPIDDAVDRIDFRSAAGRWRMATILNPA